MCSPSCYDWWPLGNHGVLKCFQGTQSASFGIWTPLDNFFWSRWLALSLSLSLSPPLPACLSVCLSLSVSLTQTLSQSLSLSLSLSSSLAPGSLFKNWHLSACSQKHLSELLFRNSKAAPSSSRSRVEVVVVVGRPYVTSLMSTRRSAKPVKKRLGSIQEELQKSFPTAATPPEKAPDHLEPENAAQKRRSEENVHDELQRSVKTPSNLQRKVAFCPPRRRRAPLLRCNMSDLKSVYKGYIRPRLEYACAVWSGGNTSKLLKLQQKFCRQHQVQLPNLSNRFKFHTLTLFYKIRNGLAPTYLSEILPETLALSSGRNLRRHVYPFPRINKSSTMQSFLPRATVFWNELPASIQSSSSLHSFKAKLRDLLKI